MGMYGEIPPDLSKRQTDRQTDRQAGRQADRQTDRHTHRHMTYIVRPLYGDHSVEKNHAIL